jgi:hypothetical protein
MNLRFQRLITMTPSRLGISLLFCLIAALFNSGCLGRAQVYHGLTVGKYDKLVETSPFAPVFKPGVILFLNENNELELIAGCEWMLPVYQYTLAVAMDKVYSITPYEDDNSPLTVNLSKTYKKLDWQAIKK